MSKVTPAALKVITDFQDSKKVKKVKKEKPKTHAEQIKERDETIAQMAVEMQRLRVSSASIRGYGILQKTITGEDECWFGFGDAATESAHKNYEEIFDARETLGIISVKLVYLDPRESEVPEVIKAHEEENQDDENEEENQDDEKEEDSSEEDVRNWHEYSQEDQAAITSGISPEPEPEQDVFALLVAEERVRERSDPQTIFGNAVEQEDEQALGSDIADIVVRRRSQEQADEASPDWF
jgi:hypothetical protein